MKCNKSNKTIKNISASFGAIATGFIIGLFAYGLLSTVPYIFPKTNIANADGLLASCSVILVSADTATWVATVSGGTGTVTYSWSGTDGLSDTTATTTITYTTSGTKIGTVTIASGGSNSSATCSIEVTVSGSPSPPPLSPPECSDGFDNDEDSLIDFPDDPGCTDGDDEDETDTPNPDPDPDPTPIPTPTPNPSPSPAPPSPPSSPGGGGGGGTPIRLEISNEKVEQIAENTALVSWDTNLQANGQVFYGKDSHSTSSLPFAEYTYSTSKTNTLVIKHSATITGLSHNVPYYFRPAAFRSNEEKGGIELMLTLEGGGESIVPAVCSEYLFEYIKYSEDNNTVEVKKLQIFLNDFEGFNLDVTGIYDMSTFEAVEIFQERYADDILTPWSIEGSTGYVYITTKKKINEIYCNKLIAFSFDDVTGAQKVEIEEFRALLESLRARGIQVDTSKVGIRRTTPSIPTDTFIADADDTPSFSDAISGEIIESEEEIIDNDYAVASVIIVDEAGERNEAIKKFLRNINIGNFLRVLFHTVF